MKRNTNVMACGCAVITEENGKVTTSVDQLVKFMNRIFARSESQTQRRSAAVQA